jgi:predicted membrane protein
VFLGDLRDCVADSGDSVDVFVVLANINLIAAHLIGTAISFLLLERLAVCDSNRIHHYRQQYHCEHLPE